MVKKLTQNVNKDKLFNDLPKVRPEMSKWITKLSNYQSCNLGQIVPIYYDEVLPNEKREVTMAMCSHTTTPVAPIFNSLYTEIRAFVVPIRLCADLLNGYKTRKSPWVKVFGEDPASTSADIVVPLGSQKLPDFTVDHQFIADLETFYAASSELDNVFNSLDLPSSSGLTDCNYLALAAYELIYQRHYRNENYEAATSSVLYRLLFDAYNSSKSSVSVPSTFSFEYANREKDYFTGMKPYTQKGDAPTVGLVGSAPIVAHDGTTFATSTLSAKSPTGTFTINHQGESGNLCAINDEQGFAAKMFTNDHGVFGNVSQIGNLTIDTHGMKADLSSVNGISVEELRLLIKTQELLEKDAMYGSLYAESLNAHFGCCPIDLTLQDPKEIYKTTITSQMQAIFQTSSTASEESILGTIGANSTTQTDPFVIIPETKFEEHSIIMVCAVHKLQNVYDSRFFMPKFNLKKARFDFYTPELNDLGYQSVTNKEWRVSGVPSSAGFNEAFAEYRYKFNKVHGKLAEDFPYWAPAISNEYSSASSLYKEGAGILDKALSIPSSTAPQFYDAWGFEEINTKPMSLHSIPGMDGVI